MIGHQRDILATLGIDLWIPKADVCAQHQNSIWRDQSTPEILTEIIRPNTVDVVPEFLHQLNTHEILKPVIEKVQTAETIPEVAFVERELVQVETFSLQLLSLSHCAIIIDTTQITENQQQLWMNIQRAVLCEFSELTWPFPWVNTQDGRGVSVYIQGFIDAYSTDKNVLVLGEIPHFNHSKIIQLASLQEMLDQPILKKRLWQFMQTKAITLE